MEDPEAEPGHCTLVVLVGSSGGGGASDRSLKRHCQTSKSFVFTYTVSNLGNSATIPVYSVPSSGTGAAKGQFVAGSGEALPLPPLVLTEAGYLDFSEAGVAGYVARTVQLR